MMSPTHVISSGIYILFSRYYNHFYLTMGVSGATRGADPCPLVAVPLRSRARERMDQYQPRPGSPQHGDPMLRDSVTDAERSRPNRRLPSAAVSFRTAILPTRSPPCRSRSVRLVRLTERRGSSQGLEPATEFGLARVAEDLPLPDAVPLVVR